MKKVLLFSLWLVCSLYLFSQVHNEDVVALQNCNKKIIELSKTIDNMSVTLSSMEQERALFFLQSAYSLVMQSIVERGDPAHPMLTEWMEIPRKFASENPYTIYTQAPVNVKFVYKLSGKRGNNMYLGRDVYGFNLTTNNLNSNEITFAKDGTFEIYISQKKPAHAKNWIPLKGNDHTFLVRPYLKKRKGIVPITLTIQHTDNNTAARLSYLEHLQRAERFLTDYMQMLPK